MKPPALSPLRAARAVAAVAAVAMTITCGLALVPAGAANAAEGDVTWTVRTASNQLGAERTGYAYAVSPGQSIDDALVVANHGDAPVDLAVYAADGYTTESGQFDLVVAGTKSVGIGAWVAPGAEHITVAPGESVDYPFTLTVPPNATPGDYSGGIVTSLAQPESENGISVDRRLGIKMTLRVGGDLKPALAIENISANWNGGLNPLAGGDATISYTLHNTGNATISAEQSASLAGPFGWFAADAAAVEAPPQLLPGESWVVTVPIRDVPPAFLLSGTVSVVPTVIDASGSTTRLDPVLASVSGWAVPWMLLLVILVLAVLVALRLRLRRRRAALRKSAEDLRVAEAVERALTEVESVR